MQTALTKSWLPAVLILVLLSTPFAEGALPLYALPVLALIAVFLIYLLIKAQPLAKRLAVLVVSVAVTITFADLLMRPLLPWLLGGSPQARALDSWPRMPLVNRFNTSYEMTTFGDLSAFCNKEEWREYKRIKFVTDPWGFRNEPDLNQQDQPLDLIMLGDSFGAGMGTNQAETWGSLFSTKYGLKTYNLSMSLSSPWHEFINLSTENSRLKTRRGTVVLWALFEGNDLDEDYGTLDLNKLPWRGSLGRFLHRLQAFRWRSPIKRLTMAVQPGSPPCQSITAEKFLEGKEVLFYAPYVEARNRTADDVRRHRNYESLKATIHAMKDLTNAKGLDLKVVLIPTKEQVYSWMLDHSTPWSSSKDASGFSMILRETTDKEGIEFLDLKPFLVNESRRAFEESGQLLWWRDDTHWNNAGHEVAAALVYNVFLKDQTR